ncbi:hypothetical protein NC77_25725 [Janthinobacterium lividum]|nr:hypothetical protein NC77_25725 [Janthinobacterium lividum]
MASFKINRFAQEFMHCIHDHMVIILFRQYVLFLFGQPPLLPSMVFHRYLGKELLHVNTMIMLNFGNRDSPPS